MSAVQQPPESAPGPRGGSAPRLDEVAIDLRCSVVVLQRESVLLLHRTHYTRGALAEDWVLPGGRPREGESMVACARREALEETGLDVTVGRCLYVLEVAAPQNGARVVELVFQAEFTGETPPNSEEADRRAVFVSLAQLGSLRLSPPLAGHLRGLRPKAPNGAAYLGNLWRPDNQDLS